MPWLKIVEHKRPIMCLKKGTPDFRRYPSFIVAGGVFWHMMGGSAYPIELGDEIRYRKHGAFMPLGFDLRGPVIAHIPRRQTAAREMVIVPNELVVITDGLRLLVPSEVSRQFSWQFERCANEIEMECRLTGDPRNN